MIRKALVVVLTLAALGTGGLIALGHWNVRTTPRFAQKFRNYSADPRYRLTYEIRRSRLVISRSTNYCLTCDMIAPDHAGSCPTLCVFGLPHFRKQNLSQVSVPGFTWESYACAGVKSRVFIVDLWLPLALLASYPILAFIRGPLRRRRRKKRGRCLTGLTEPRCPECGAGFELPSRKDADQ